MLHVFKFNFTEMPPMTMEKAVEMCRECALHDNKATSLFIQCRSGKFILLADYEPIAPKAMQLYRTDPKNLKSPIVPQVEVTIY